MNGPHGWGGWPGWVAVVCVAGLTLMIGGLMCAGPIVAAVKKWRERR